MAIEKLTSPQAVASSSADWVAAVSLIEKAFLNYENGLRIDYDNDLVLSGSIFQAGGSVYIATGDTSITGTPSDYVKLTISGSNLVPSYVANLTGVTWNTTYKGYYDVSGNLYVFDEMKARFDEVVSAVNKRSGNYAENIIDYSSDYSDIRLNNRAKFVFKGASGGTAAGTGSWKLFTIDTTEYNNITGVSLSSNKVSLPAGKYYIDCFGSFFRVGLCYIKLYNETLTSDIEVSLTQWANSAISTGYADIDIKKIFLDISSSTEISLYYYVQTSTGVGDLGNGFSSTVNLRGIIINKVDQ